MLMNGQVKVRDVEEEMLRIDAKPENEYKNAANKLRRLATGGGVEPHHSRRLIF